MNKHRDFLPISRADMLQRGWYYYDFLVITGDAYVDHPSFGTAIISRVLEAEGYRVAILACPAGAPFLGKKWGKEPPGEEVPPPGPPSLVGLCGGRLYFLRDTRPAALTLEGP